MFADNTNIYFESDDLVHMQKVVNRELHKVRKWLEANRLALNIDKTNFIIFHSPQHKLTDHIVLKIGNKKIKQESYVRFLGVLLDSNLSWNFHLSELSKKLARTACLFYKIRHYAQTDILTLLYHAIFEPFLLYGLSVWGMTYPSFLERIYVLQKKVLKAITFSDITASSDPLFDRLQVLELADLFQVQILSFVYECVNKIAPSYFSGYFTSINMIQNIGTCQSKKGDLSALGCNTTKYGIRSIHYSGFGMWNSLPSDIKASKSLSNFKKTLKSYLLASYNQ